MVKQSVFLANRGKKVMSARDLFEYFWNSGFVLAIFEIILFNSVIEFPQTAKAQWISFDVKIPRIHFQYVAKQVADERRHIGIDRHLRNRAKLATLKAKLLDA